MFLLFLGLWGTAPPLILRAQSSDGEARVLAEEEKDAIRTWAHQRLMDLDSGSFDRSSKAPHRWETERLWALYFLSVEEKEWEEPAVALADSLATQDLPEALHIRALGGALEVVRAKNSRWPPNKLEHLRKGISVLDGLVEEAPADPVIRYLRLVSCYYLPFFLDRDESVVEDFGVLASVLPEKGDAFSPPVRSAVLRFILDKGELEGPARIRLEEALGELEPLQGQSPVVRKNEGVQTPPRERGSPRTSGIESGSSGRIL